MNRSLLPVLLSALLASAPPVSAADKDPPPLLPSSLSLVDLSVPTDIHRTFHIAVEGSQKGLVWEISSAQEGLPLAGAFEVGWVGGAVLGRQELVGKAHSGYVDLSGSTGARRLRVTIYGGDNDMRLNLRLPGATTDLRQGQATAVYPERTGDTAYRAVRNLRLSKRSDVQIATWGGDAEVKLQVFGPPGTGAPPLLCQDAGDAWRQCRLPLLGPGLYSVEVTGQGNPVQLMARWTASED